MFGMILHVLLLVLRLVQQIVTCCLGIACRAFQIILGLRAGSVQVIVNGPRRGRSRRSRCSRCSGSSSLDPLAIVPLPRSGVDHFRAPASGASFDIVMNGVLLSINSVQAIRRRSRSIASLVRIWDHDSDPVWGQSIASVAPCKVKVLIVTISDHDSVLGWKTRSSATSDFYVGVGVGAAIYVIIFSHHFVHVYVKWGHNRA